MSDLETELLRAGIYAAIAVPLVALLRSLIGPKRLDGRLVPLATLACCLLVALAMTPHDPAHALPRGLLAFAVAAGGVRLLDRQTDRLGIAIRNGSSLPPAPPAPSKEGRNGDTRGPAQP